MNARDEILARVREALRTRTDPGVRGVAGAGRTPDGPPPFRAFLPPVPGGYEERKAMFAAQAEALRAEFVCTASVAELASKLNGLALAAGWQRVAVQRNELVDLACAGLDLPVLRVDEATSADDLAACDAGVTVCEALVAQTGSVLITSRTCGGRALSILPPHHVVVARRTQLVGDLTDAFALLAQRFGRDYPSLMSFITGPSRTGDIERVLVLGAHGPRRLTIVLVES